MNVIEVKTAELEGAALDWAVALADGRDMGLFVPCGSRVQICGMWSSGCTWAPTTDWAQGGPLIEKHNAAIVSMGGGVWGAEIDAEYYMYEALSISHEGATPLIALCRAVVGWVIGETVSVPAELVAK